VRQRLRQVFEQKATWGWLLIFVSLLGLLLRIEHAVTFDDVHRASDYNVHLLGVRWMQRHWRAFFLSGSVNYQVRSYPPLWYFLSALVLKLKDDERLLATFSVAGWVMRQAVLWLMLRQAIPRQRLAQLAALTMHAVLPLSVLIDGKVNPEGLHSGIFALALYTLWQLERQSQEGGRLSLTTAAAFGALAGLALLAKITGGMLVIIGPAVFGLQALRHVRRDGWLAAWRTLGPPALVAIAAWCLVAGWWSGTNLVKFGHPFPHVWNLEGPETNPILAEPTLYRRPLGWALPFEWHGLWNVPIIRTDTDPRPNFWATEVVGAWSDLYNRGFCRLKGGGVIDRFWGGRHGFMSEHSSAWDVSGRCVDWFASMVHVGVWLTGASVLALLWCLWRSLSTLGARGSWTLVLVPLVCTGSAMSFAMTFPYDYTAVLNPRYLLSQVMPMCACLGLALAELEAVGQGRGLVAVVAKQVPPATLAVIVTIGAMLLFERFGS
jgi:hypothetical protein